MRFCIRAVHPACGRTLRRILGIKSPTTELNKWAKGEKSAYDEIYGSNPLL